MSIPCVTGYRVVSTLGEGGMGAVYRAVEESTGREVALKILRTALVTDEEYVLRFKREAKALSLVSHPNVARFHAMGVDGDILYYAMEFVEGEPLSRRIADAPLPACDAVTVAAEIADALEAAHQSGIIHRDVKPSNIILSPAGAKLTDFGLARRRDGSALTTSGRVMGSLGYMSPEQIRAEPLTAASDLYSLGVTLFESLAGCPPFTAADDAAIAARVLAEPPPLVSRLCPHAPAGLDLLLVTMLAKDSKLRPQTAAEVAAKLRRIAGGGSVEDSAASLAKPPLVASLISMLCRGALAVLPCTKTCRPLADRLAGFARLHGAASAADLALLDAVLARREMRAAMAELSLLERKRNLRLQKASEASARATVSSAEEKQSLDRLARELENEARIFQTRITSLSDEIAGLGRRARDLAEKARLLRLRR